MHFKNVSIRMKLSEKTDDKTLLLANRAQNEAIIEECKVKGLDGSQVLYQQSFNPRVLAAAVELAILNGTRVFTMDFAVGRSFNAIREELAKKGYSKEFIESAIAHLMANNLDHHDENPNHFLTGTDAALKYRDLGGSPATKNDAILINHFDVDSVVSAYIMQKADLSPQARSLLYMAADMCDHVAPDSYTLESMINPGGERYKANILYTILSNIWKGTKFVDISGKFIEMDKIIQDILDGKEDKYGEYWKDDIDKQREFYDHLDEYAEKIKLSNGILSITPAPDIHTHYALLRRARKAFGWRVQRSNATNLPEDQNYEFAAPGKDVKISVRITKKEIDLLVKDPSSTITVKGPNNTQLYVRFNNTTDTLELLHDDKAYTFKLIFFYRISGVGHDASVFNFDMRELKLLAELENKKRAELNRSLPLDRRYPILEESENWGFRDEAGGGPRMGTVLTPREIEGVIMEYYESLKRENILKVKHYFREHYSVEACVALEKIFDPKNNIDEDLFFAIFDFCKTPLIDQIVIKIANQLNSRNVIGDASILYNARLLRSQGYQIIALGVSLANITQRATVKLSDKEADIINNTPGIQYENGTLIMSGFFSESNYQYLFTHIELEEDTKTEIRRLYRASRKANIKYTEKIKDKLHLDILARNPEGIMVIVKAQNWPGRREAQTDHPNYNQYISLSDFLGRYGPSRKIKRQVNDALEALRDSFRHKEKGDASGYEILYEYLEMQLGPQLAQKVYHDLMESSELPQVLFVFTDTLRFSQNNESERLREPDGRSGITMQELDAGISEFLTDQFGEAHYLITDFKVVNEASTSQNASRVAVVDKDLKKIDELIRTVLERLNVQHFESVLREAYAIRQASEMHQEGNTLKHHIAFIQKQRLAGVDDSKMQAVLDENPELVDQFILFHDIEKQSTLGYSFETTLFLGTEGELMPSKELAKMRKSNPEIYEQQIALQRRVLGVMTVDELSRLGVSITHYGHAEASADFVTSHGIASPDSLLTKAVRYHMEFIGIFTKSPDINAIQRLISSGLTPEEIRVIAALATLDLLGSNSSMTKDEKYALWANVNIALEVYDKKQQERKSKSQVEVPKEINALLGSKLKGNYRKFLEKWPSILGVLKNDKMPADKKKDVVRNILNSSGLSEGEIEIVLSNLDKITEIAKS